MADPKKWTDYFRIEGEGRSGVLSVCRTCGAAVFSEAWLPLDVMPFDLHEKWHAEQEAPRG